ncbi:hypothetical protein IMSAGC019_00387 [Lachnospiraceae bacterium]|nr:hypothetical protein IMSAGC019_00387 [Lachnospiraceae bacterium]
MAICKGLEALGTRKSYGQKGGAWPGKMGKSCPSSRHM